MNPTPNTRAGSILATLNLVPKARFTPTQKMRMLPRKERLSITSWRNTGASRPAQAVMAPWRTPTGRAAKSTPLPYTEAITITTIPSITALV